MRYFILIAMIFLFGCKNDIPNNHANYFRVEYIGYIPYTNDRVYSVEINNKKYLMTIVRGYSVIGPEVSNTKAEKDEN
jgi:hypothetical protein